MGVCVYVCVCVSVCVSVSECVHTHVGILTFTTQVKKFFSGCDCNNRGCCKKTFCGTGDWIPVISHYITTCNTVENHIKHQYNF